MNDQTLTDPFGRRIAYLRLSVTDRCDLRCGYCLPKGFKGFEEPEHWLTFEEITRVVGAFTALGVGRVRITGGEPLVRRNPARAGRRAVGAARPDDLSISSNCTRMESLAEPLYRAGVRRLNVSLDSLRPEVFKQVTGGDLDKVLRGIRGGTRGRLRPGFASIPSSCAGVNDAEIEDILGYCADNGFTLRLIETMPMGATGQAARDQYLDLQTVRRRLEQRFTLIPDILPGGGPARYFRLGATETRIGFITPISQHFCETCNRVRLTVDGTLYLCLGQDSSYALRPLLRDSIGDDELLEHLKRAIILKPERHEFNERPEKVIRFMSMTGG